MSSIQLSILVPSVHTRRNTYLPTSLNSLYEQWEKLSKEKQDQVEILFLVDNKTLMLGEKRNEMVRLAQGEYVVHVDDDDRVEPDYIESLLDAMWSNPDVITYQVSVSLNSQRPKICHYSKDYEKDYNTSTTYHRLPNHICCVRRDIASKVSFPNIAYGEDSAYAKLLKPMLETEEVIDRVLYHYDYNEISTETQMHLTNRKARVREGDKPLVDLVILSKAKTDEEHAMTQRAIDTAIAGANGLPINVIVVEQESASYNNASMVYTHDEPFNYNRFANKGAAVYDSPWVMVANNDLVFTDAWLHHLLAAHHPIVSPKCPKDGRQVHVTANATGDTNGVFFSGWCFMIKRELLEKIGGLDEDVSFWCSDDATIEQLKAVGVLPMLVPDSKVEHLGSTTLKKLPSKEQGEMCWGQVEIFNKKYNQNKFADNPHFRAWKQLK